MMGPSPPSSLGLRLVTGFSFAALSLLAMASSSPVAPFVFVLVLLGVCLWELRTLASEWTMWPLALLVFGSVVALQLVPLGVAPWLALGFWASGVVGVLAWGHGVRGLGAMACLSGWLSGCMGACLWAQGATRLTADPVSLNLVFVVVPCLWVGDTAAFVIGKKWGRHKLAPGVSPGKTWEGAAGHLLGSAACSTGFASLVGLPLWVGLTTGVVASVAGQAGDLLQSFLKRSAAVKDSGTVLPGHGGLLDRIDSMLVAVPPQIAFLWVVAPQMFHVKP